MEFRLLSTDPSILIPAVVTLAVFSILYRENPVFRAVERLGVGLAAGYAFILIVRTGLIPRLSKALGAPFDPSSVLLLLPLAAGIGLVMSAVGHRTQLARFAVAGAAAIGAGLALPLLMQALVLSQMKASMVPMGLSSVVGFNALVIAICVLTTMAYFSFTREPTGIRALFAISGLYTLMIAFGATFASLAMSRITLLIGRFLFLLRDVFHLVQ